MIDVANEKLIPVREVPKYLPRRPNKKTIHISAIYRWAHKGLQGHKLEIIRIGGTSYTSREAIQRFADALSGCHQHQNDSISPLTKSRQSQALRAEQLVYQELGIRPSDANQSISFTPECTLRCKGKQM